ncbi:MAG TPA: phosphoenolpyruvate synthase, partial [Candidatus Omnitrophota bacterium]|nr:phosphoenolpyruvate synthase [Candidatus Omnitrophota bacterium]
KTIKKAKVLFESKGNFLGGNIPHKIDTLIYVDPQGYCDLAAQSEKYAIARVIGELNRRFGDREKKTVMLLGPGRWGTSTPSLGVPVTFAEINNITVLGEIAFASGNVAPEISFGTHFFQDLVETGIFYVALFPDNPDNRYNRKFFGGLPKNLGKILPQYQSYAHVVKVFEAKENRPRIVADVLSQRMICYFQ